jgi:hypothetical protein
MPAPVVLVVRDPDSFREQLRLRLRDLGYRIQISDVEAFLHSCPLAWEVLLLSIPAARGGELLERLGELLLRPEAPRPGVILYTDEPAALPGRLLAPLGGLVVGARDPAWDLSALCARVYQARPSIGPSGFVPPAYAERSR